MPQYRKLYTKSLESLDITSMPDDFTRLTWLMLPLICCREGRGMDYPTWLRSKLYPLRQDVSDTMVKDAFDWFASHKMIVRYEVDGRKYFHIPTWSEYQGNTTKETPSIYPGPELVKSKSRPTPEQSKSNDGQSLPLVNNESASEDDSEDESESVEPFRVLFDAFLDSSGISELMLVGHKAVDEITNKWIPANVTADEVKVAVKALQDKSYNITGPWSITNTINMMRSKRKGKAPKPGSAYKLPDDWNDYEDDEADEIQEDVPEIDTKWRTFIEEYVTSRHWQNLLEFGGYDDAGKVIVKVPEAEMAEAKDRFGSTLHRYFMGEYILASVA